jgi:enoyl-CoA hydratase
MNYENILVETKGAVGLITLNRHKALNALNSAVISEINVALAAFDADDQVGCVVITGSDKAFAAGADIKEMAGKTYVDAYRGNFLGNWSGPSEARKPMIAAVSGYCLGGGLELALICDFIIAAETAKFGLPEITLGIMPGGGGTQRLARFVGKAKAMDLILTGRMMEAAEAERCGLVARLAAPEKLMDEALTAAAKIASHSQVIAMMAKESVNRSFETNLAEGLRFERRLFLSMFATEDQKEGMQAFIEKRKPEFKNR